MELSLFDASLFRASTLITLIVVGFLVYSVSLTVYRLYFDPLARAKIPGPKLAAASFWYEFYYDCLRRGECQQYTWKIKELHEKYGPIIRINPYEVHILDPDFYDKIYTGPSGGRREKWEWFAKVFDNPISMFGTCDHDLHRFRRGLLSSYFSRRAVTALEPTIRSLVDRMVVRMREDGRGGRPVQASSAFSALTMDVITEYSFASSYECIESPDFERGKRYMDGVMGITMSGHLVKHMSWLLPVMKSIPLWVARVLNPGMALMFSFQNDVYRMVYRAQAGELRQSGKGKTMFEELLEADIPASEKSTQRLKEEGQNVIGAGMVTTAHYLAYVAYSILANPDIHRKLKAELVEAMPKGDEELSVVQLEKLPYLSAVWKEGLRRTYGALSRLPRISPDSPIEYGKYTIPPGTPVSMSCKLIHDDPNIFADAEVFRPERWLDAEGQAKEKYLVNFSRGTRQCLGLNLAGAEIMLGLSTVFRRLDMQLYETTWEDFEIVYDYIVPGARKSSRGLRVTIS